jgi:hypothetical protein
MLELIVPPLTGLRNLGILGGENRTGGATAVSSQILGTRQSASLQLADVPFDMTIYNI